MHPRNPFVTVRQRLAQRLVRGRSLMLLVLAGSLLITTLTLHAEQQSGDQTAAVADARQRAELMHAIHAETLHVMHERYFHGARAIVPARAMEDIFATLKRQSGVETRWMSVNVRAMSLHHEPKTEFELGAAKEIAAGKPAVEAVADGYYHHIGAIPMTAGCVACHDGFGKPPTAAPKFAALVISIPLPNDSPAAPAASDQ